MGKVTRGRSRHISEVCALGKVCVWVSVFDGVQSNMSNKRRAEDAFVLKARTARTEPVRAVDPVAALVSMRRSPPMTGGGAAAAPPREQKRAPVREIVDLTDDDGVVIPDFDDEGEVDEAPLPWTEEDKERARAEASENVEMGKHICGACLYPTPVDDLDSCRSCGLVYCPMCVPIKATCPHAKNAIYCDTCVGCTICEPDVQAQFRARRAKEIVCVTPRCNSKISSELFADRGWRVCHVCTYAVCEACLRVCGNLYPLCLECVCTCRRCVPQ